MLLASAWFGHQNLSHQGGEGASPVHRSHQERCQSDLTLAREECVITEGSRLCFCLRVPRRVLDNRSFGWLAVLFLCGLVFQPLPSPSELSICMRAVPGREIRSYAFPFQMWIYQAPSLWLFSSSRLLSPRGGLTCRAAYAQMQLSFRASLDCALRAD